MIITENQLDEWVRGNAQKAQGVIVELVYRLVVASSPNPRERRFPLGDSVGQHGPDGFLDTDSSLDPFVPNGKSFWEIGTGLDAATKATANYKGLTESTPESVRAESTFVFVTPLSGRRDWQYTWKEDDQAEWLAKRRKNHEWSDVQVIDGSRLVDWLKFFPGTELWLAGIMGKPVHELEIPEQRWVDLRTIGDPPPLIPEVFTSNRSAACEKLNEILAGNAVRLKLDTHYPTQMADFVAAHLATFDPAAQPDRATRCVIIKSPQAWISIATLPDPHVLVADFALDDTDSEGLRLLEKAKARGHAVIFSGMPGGIPDSNRLLLSNPNTHQLTEALKKAGYPEERARTLSQKSNGNLNSLLRCLQSLSVLPDWSTGTEASELAIAELLGGWKETSEADRSVVEKLSGKEYGEWIGMMREISLRPGTPLSYQDGTWKFALRYEGWYALGSRIFDDRLDRVRESCALVLTERDPALDLDPNERYLAAIHNQVLKHSHVVRKGLAETLALIGGHSDALTTSTSDKAAATAKLTTRDILGDADWKLWASLNDVLPLLAEAAPNVFLDCVEGATHEKPSPFSAVFAQEGKGITGSNYMTGLLWALETLAWSPELLTRVIVTLGELAELDPGGNWANRPENSIVMILLPWFPQTAADVSIRRTALRTLLQEVPEIGWKVVLRLLLNAQQSSSMTRKPAWREFIPDHWSEGVTQREFWEQTEAYSELAVDVAKTDPKNLTVLIDQLNNLSPAASAKLIDQLRSEEILTLSEEKRLPLWNELIDFVTRHKKFSSAPWAIGSDQLNQIEEAASKLAPFSPSLRHQRLFTERDHHLYEEHGNYHEQARRLEELRQTAVAEVFDCGGVTAIIQFAETVETPWRVGVAFGIVGPIDVDSQILPEMMGSQRKPIAQFTGAFVLGRFRTQGWKWIEGLDLSEWTVDEKATLLGFLPFAPDTWLQAEKMLGESENIYWLKTHANPYDATERLDWAVDKLIENQRVNAAISALERLFYNDQSIEPDQIVRVIDAMMKSPDSLQTMDPHAVTQLIKVLQKNPPIDVNDLFRIEWAFIGLLNENFDASPTLLERTLAQNPDFFCEVIRAIFRSDKAKEVSEEKSETQQPIATAAYKLLREWKIPPGTEENSTFNPNHLNDWLSAVRASATESGHLTIAMEQVGEVLFYAPADPDGLWIHRSVATVLNAKDAEDLRRGYFVGVFNSRGVHFVDPEGKPERELADNFRKRANEIESAGFHRFAVTLRDIAAAYDQEAEQNRRRVRRDY
jgi:hypothetical protein